MEVHDFVRVERSTWWAARMEENWSCSLKKFKEILFIKEIKNI